VESDLPHLPRDIDKVVIAVSLDGSGAVAIEIYHRNPDWKVRAVGQGWTDGLAGLARDFGIDIAD